MEVLVMTEHLISAATVFLILFGIVAAFDGLYLHLWKYRLYARPESRREHKLHTAQAFLFVPVLFFLFYKDFGGWALWAGVLFIALEQVVEIIDVLDENDSRASLGGLSSTEYATHVIAITARTVAIALALAAKPLSAWSLDAPVVIGPEHSFASGVAFKTIIGNLIIAGLHVWLMRSKYHVESSLLPVRLCCQA
jgi:hypothetical protein